ncbi:hypothetical protein L798_01259 [Zootermopsis nevadensis]|uniref:Uncharacterized protein n=1 Tax=Zootermopsis nevadensis TaxID=136037 RepID=A0A067QJV7_ZOONE|nr:hypothetical protein L798_01259 [Zootermopsis nevadensis]
MQEDNIKDGSAFRWANARWAVGSVGGVKPESVKCDVHSQSGPHSSPSCSAAITGLTKGEIIELAPHFSSGNFNGCDWNEVAGGPECSGVTSAFVVGPSPRCSLKSRWPFFGRPSRVTTSL